MVNLLKIIISLFNELCKKFKKEYSVEPQELDILLVNFGSNSTHYLQFRLMNAQNN